VCLMYGRNCCKVRGLVGMGAVVTALHQQYAEQRSRGGGAHSWGDGGEGWGGAH